MITNEELAAAAENIVKYKLTKDELIGVLREIYYLGRTNPANGHELEDAFKRGQEDVMKTISKLVGSFREGLRL